MPETTSTSPRTNQTNPDNAPAPIERKTQVISSNRCKLFSQKKATIQKAARDIENPAFLKSLSGLPVI